MIFPFKKYLPLMIIFVITVLRVTIFTNTINFSAVFSFLPVNFVSSGLNTIKNLSVDQTRKYLPSPHSELLLGMVIGLDDLGKVTHFKDMLVATGTIHVVVVSGFNISLVFNMVMKLLGSPYKLKHLLIAQSATFFYAVLSGFESPVIRAWIMGSIVAWGKYYGRGISVIQVLLFSAMVMLVIQPEFITSLSFQLSFLATFSLVLYSSFFDSLFKKIKVKFPLFKLLLADLSTTLAAQILVTPLISYSFGRVSLISPIVNMLILWTVPLSTVLGGVFLFCGFLGSFVSWIVSIPTYVFLDVFVWVVETFGQISFLNINAKMSLTALIVYYVSMLVIYFVCHKVSCRVTK